MSAYLSLIAISYARFPPTNIFGFFSHRCSKFTSQIQDISVPSAKLSFNKKAIWTELSFNRQSITGLKIQADPGTVFYLKEIQDTDLERHVIGATGLLDFYDDNTSIQGLYFIGPHLNPAINNNFAKDDEFIETGLIYDTFE